MGGGGEGFQAISLECPVINPCEYLTHLYIFNVWFKAQLQIGANLYLAKQIIKPYIYLLDLFSSTTLFLARVWVYALFLACREHTFDNIFDDTRIPAGVDIFQKNR